MTHDQTPPNKTSRARLLLDPAACTAEIAGPNKQAVAEELRVHLNAIDAASHRGDRQAFALAVARAYAVLDRIQIEWVRGDAP